MTANLFTPPARLSGEIFETLAAGRGEWKLERIVSFGQASPEEFWYDQAHTEWVLLLQGSATLEFAEEPPVHLKPGDHLILPAHKRHRVSAVSEDAIWLALHTEVQALPV
jgi:cupin 2 domain-containing protein